MANIEMKIDRVNVSQMNNQPVVILKEKKGARYLSIWMGPSEANAIAVKMQNAPVSRPLPYDVLCAAIDTLGARIQSVSIAGLKNDVFYALIVLRTGREEKQMYLDCRPSDALAVAVRKNAPVYVDEQVLEKAGFLLDKKTGEFSALSSEGVPVKQAAGSENIDILSEPVQDILAESEAEAKRMNCSYVCTGHVLTALSKRMSTATKIMENAGVRVGRIQLDIRPLMEERQAVEGGGVGLTSAVKEAIGIAVAEAKRLGSGEVLPEHVLLGLARASDGIAASYLGNLGITPETIYVELIRFFRPYLLQRV